MEKRETNGFKFVESKHVYVTNSISAGADNGYHVQGGEQIHFNNAIANAENLTPESMLALLQKDPAVNETISKAQNGDKKAKATLKRMLESFGSGTAVQTLVIGVKYLIKEKFNIHL